MSATNHVLLIHRTRDDYDSLKNSLRRAAAIADLIECSRENCLDALDQGSIPYAAQAIRMEMRDAEIMLEAFRDEHLQAVKGIDHE